MVVSSSNSILDPSITFPDLCDSVGLDVRLRKAVSRLGHIRPTLVQSKCLPLAINSGRDILVRARTGSGKTLAYSLPLLSKLLNRRNKRGVGAIVLVPTRELCSQVSNILQNLMYYCDDVLSSCVVLTSTSSNNKASSGGGRSNNAQQQEERERQEALLRDDPDVIVATPAGLLSHIRTGSLRNLNKTVETLVVDEADLVLSFGYSNDIAEIVKSLPRICQGFLMSATLSPEVDSLKKIVLNSPVVLKLEQEDNAANNKSVGQLKQFYIAMPKKDKNLVLYVFLKLGLLKGKGLFFVNTTDAGYRLKLFLEQFHIRSAVLNSELPFRSRLNIIEQFNVGNFDYLIATDNSTDVKASSEKNDDGDDDDDSEVKEKEEDTNNKKKSKRRSDSEYGVSRGLDFRNVSFVVNVDFPMSTKGYSHRIGRTARGGAKGVALSLVDINSRIENAALLDVQSDQPTVPLMNAASAASDDKLHAATAAGVVNGGTATSTPTSSSQPGQQQQQEVQQPMPLDFDLRELEGFRYRVEDVQRAVTRLSVREARAAELKAEILNSERLSQHFHENPADLQLLRHDRVVQHRARIQEHLKHVPKYLLPQGMQVANLNRRKRKKRNKNKNRGACCSDYGVRSDNDPLRAFDGGGDVDLLDGVQDSNNNNIQEDEFAEFMDDGGDDDDDGGEGAAKKKQKTAAAAEAPKVYTGTQDGTGQSTAGRNAWKEKHKKGKFSNKKRMVDRRKNARQPLGI